MANFIRVAGILILVITGYSVGNINEDHRVLNEDLRDIIWNGTLKRWSPFVSKLTETVVRKGLVMGLNIHNDLNFLNVLQCLHYKAKDFGGVAMSTKLAPTANIIDLMNNFIKVNITKPLGKLRKLLPLSQGFVQEVEKQNFWQVAEKLYANNRFTWSFSASSFFNLKCNFQKIYFSSYISTKCHWGQLNMKNYFIKEETTFVYCGQYPDMINYSNSPKVDIIILTKL